METEKRSIWSYLIGFIIGVFVTAIMAGSVFAIIGIRSYVKRNAEKEEISDSAEGTSADTVISDESLEKIKTIEDAIDTYYYQTDIDRSEEANSIYKGIVDSLGDPYSEYYTAAEYEDLMAETKGVYYGIGAYVSMDKSLNLPRITGTISDSPAESAGLVANDIIYKVDGVKVADYSLSEVVSMIHGDRGTKVTLTIFRESESDYIDVDVIRDEVEVQTVNSTMLENDIGYIGITEFDSVTTEQFISKMDELKDRNMKALIIDLRSNPGGNLSAVCNIARELLPEGDIVYTIDRNGNREDYTCDGSKEIQIPLAVLVNGFSASASEILSGAIKDYGKGTIIGETTYGKGVVQRIFPFSDGTAVKLTISSYYTPNGNNINGLGIEPDIEIELDTDAYSKDGTDNQLEKAVEILTKELGSD